MTLGRPHTLLLDSAEFREDLDDAAQIVFEALWRRGDPQTFGALADGGDAIDAALLFARSRGRFLRASSRQVFERALDQIEGAGLAELVREAGTGRVIEAAMLTTSAERAWMARVAARQALITANDAPAGEAAPITPPPPRQQKENRRTSVTRWMERWRADHPDDTRDDDALEAHYFAQVYTPGKPGRKPKANGTQAVAAGGNDTRPETPNDTRAVASAISVSLREVGERDSLSRSPLSGDSEGSDARETPGRNDTQPNDTQPPCVSLPAEQPPRPSTVEHPGRSSEPAPEPAAPLDPGLELVRLLREGAGMRLGDGSDMRLGAALLALQVTPSIAQVMGELAGRGALAGQAKDEHGNPREVFPVGLLLAGRDGDRQWLQSWVGHAKGAHAKRQRQAAREAEYEAAKNRPVAQQRLGGVADNTLPARPTGPPVAAPTSAPLGPGPSKVELTQEERLKAFREVRAKVGKTPT